MTMSDHDFESLLREQLGQVDSLTPPSDADDFAAQALAQGQAAQAAGARQHADRRKSWTRGLLGVAAAIAVFALAVPVLRSFSGTTAGGTASSAVAPEQGQDLGGQSGGGAPVPSVGQAPQGQGQGDIPETVVPPRLTEPLVPDNPGGSPTTYTVGSVPYDWSTEQARATIRKLRATYGPAVLTSLVVGAGTTPARLVVRMPVLDESVVAAIVAAFPADAPITVVVG